MKKNIVSALVLGFSLSAAAADFPTGTFVCNYQDTNQKAQKATITITETNLGASLPIVDIVAPGFKLRGVASVYNGGSGYPFLTLTGWAKNEDIYFHPITGIVMELGGAFGADCK